MLFRLTAILLLLTSHVPLFSQDLSLRQININQGLPSSEVYSVIQDRKGYIWFSTDEGVARFNGRDFTIFTRAEGLTDNTIFRLMEDRHGRIWMIGYNGSVCYFEKDSIIPIPASDSLVKLLQNGVTYIHSSALDGGDTLWLGTIHMLIAVPPQDGYSRVMRDTTFHDSTMTVIRSFSNKSSVISSYTKKTLSELKPRIIEGASVISVTATGLHTFRFQIDDNVTTNTNPSRRSIMLRDSTLLFTNKNILFRRPPGAAPVPFILENTIISLTQDRKGDLWVGCSKGGVLRFRQGDLTRAPDKFLQEYSVSGVLTDHENGTWFTTLESGVFYAPMANYSDYNQDPVLAGKICGLDAVQNGVLVSNNRSQYWFIDSTGKVIALKQEAQYIASRPARFYQFGDSIICFGGRSGLIDLNRKEIRYFKNVIGAPLSALDGARCSNGQFLILGGNNLFQLHGTTAAQLLLTPARALCILHTSSGITYIGTRNGIFQYEEGNFKRLFDQDQKMNQTIFAMEEDDQGRIWIGTKEHGLAMIHKGQLRWFGPETGLSSQPIYALLPDTGQHLWVGGNKGVSLLKITGSSGIEFRSAITRFDGLPSNEITRLTRFRHKLYIGTKEGLSVVDLRSPVLDQTPPPVYISRILVNREDAGGTDLLHLDFEQNNFRFYIDCIASRALFNPGYYYRLNGLDTAMQYSEQAFLDFSHVPAGRYALEVWGVNHHGVRSLQPAMLSFTIAPPFWQQWWFVLLSALGTLLLAALYMRQRFKAIRKKANEKARLNTLLAESQMTALRAQMNPHFMFNAINSIQNFIVRENTDKAYDYLAKFSKLIRMVLGNSKNSTVTLEQELEMLTLYLELELMRFDDAFRFHLNVDPALNPAEVMIPGMLIQPFIENAIWHGIMPLNGIRTGILTVTIRPENDHLMIVIEDNGIGREKSRQLKRSETHQSMGMLLTRDRLNLLNNVQHSALHQVWIDDLYDSGKQPTGTRVRLQIPLYHHHED